MVLTAYTMACGAEKLDYSEAHDVMLSAKNVFGFRTPPTWQECSINSHFVEGTKGC